jgi:FMN phosphatase YigB (HAD superfamily)
MLETESKPAEPIALFDIDGTLADFDASMRLKLGELRAPSEDPQADTTAFEDVPYVRARRRLIKAQPGFWRELAPISLGFQLLEEARAQRFLCQILSKSPRKIPAAAGEKIEWCVRYVPDLPIVLSEDKGLVYGKLLCDDWPEYIERWLTWRPRGLVVAVAQPWNVGIDAKFSRNVVRFDGTNFPYVRERMQEIRVTAGY